MLNVHCCGLILHGVVLGYLFIPCSWPCTAISTHTLSFWFGNDSLGRHELVMADQCVAERKEEAKREACQFRTTHFIRSNFASIKDIR